MPPLLRSILVVLLGWFVGSVVMMGLHFASLLVYPLPEGVSLWDMEAIKKAAPNMPAGAWLAVSLAHGLGTLAGAWLAARLAGRAPMVHALIIGAVFLASGIINLMNMEPPETMWWIGPLDLALYPSAGLLAGWLARRK